METVDQVFLREKLRQMVTQSRFQEGCDLFVNRWRSSRQCGEHEVELLTDAMRAFEVSILTVINIQSYVCEESQRPIPRPSWNSPKLFRKFGLVSYQKPVLLVPMVSMLQKLLLYDSITQLLIMFFKHYVFWIIFDTKLLENSKWSFVFCFSGLKDVFR